MQDRAAPNENENAADGSAVRDSSTDGGPADYALFVATDLVDVAKERGGNAGHNKTGALNDRQPSWSEQSPEGRWRACDYADLPARDACSLDLFWLKDERLRDAENLPEPDGIAAEIAEDLRVALEQIEEILGDLAASG